MMKSCTCYQQGCPEDCGIPPTHSIASLAQSKLFRGHGGHILSLSFPICLALSLLYWVVCPLSPPSCASGGDLCEALLVIAVSDEPHRPSMQNAVCCVHVLRHWPTGEEIARTEALLGR